MSVPIFPTLPASVGVSYTEAQYEDPTLVVTFENGWEEVRPRRSIGRYVHLKVVYTGNATDIGTIIAFLISCRLQATPFQYTHPLAGTVIARYAKDTIDLKTMVQGTTYWYQLEVDLRVLYGNT